MRVWLAADDSACGYWRMRLPQAHLGDEVEFVDVETVSACYLEDDVLEVEPPDVDVAVFQRPVRARALELIEALQRAGTAVVVEMDDDLRNVHPDNYGYLSMIGRYEDIHWSHAELAAQIADLVTVTTPALAKRYGAHGRVAVIRTTSRRRCWRSEPSASRHCWSAGPGRPPITPATWRSPTAASRQPVPRRARRSGLSAMRVARTTHSGSR